VPVDAKSKSILEFQMAIYKEIALTFFVENLARNISINVE
jgi:hypothetical protein